MNTTQKKIYDNFAHKHKKMSEGNIIIKRTSSRMSDNNNTNSNSNSNDEKIDLTNDDDKPARSSSKITTTTDPAPLTAAYASGYTEKSSYDVLREACTARGITYLTKDKKTDLLKKLDYYIFTGKNLSISDEEEEEEQEEQSEEATTNGYNEKSSVDALKEACKTRGISYRARATKAELLKLLDDFTANKDKNDDDSKPTKPATTKRARTPSPKGNKKSKTPSPTKRVKTTKNSKDEVEEEEEDEVKTTDNDGIFVRMNGEEFNFTGGRVYTVLHFTKEIQPGLLATRVGVLNGHIVGHDIVQALKHGDLLH
jgi:hypothetical protein